MSLETALDEIASEVRFSGLSRADRGGAPMVSRGYGMARRDLGYSWSPPATTPTGSTAKPRSPSSAVLHPSRPAADAPAAATGSAAAATGPRTARCTSSPSSGCDTTNPPATTSTSHCRRTEQARDHPLPQALHRPRGLRQPASAGGIDHTGRSSSISGLTNIGASSGSTGPPSKNGPTPGPTPQSPNEQPASTTGSTPTITTAATPHSPASHQPTLYSICVASTVACRV